MSETETKTRITQIGTVGIPVADHDKALEFYVGTLGFEVRLDGEFAPGQRWVEVAPAGAASTIALAPAHPGSPAGVDTGIRLSTPDAEADHAHLLASGADVRRSCGGATACRRCSPSATPTATLSTSSSGPEVQRAAPR